MNIRSIALLVILSTLLAGCGDSFTEPDFLESQQELSRIAKDRHYQVAVYYEGVSEQENKRFHVFAEVIISKFTKGRNISLFYLPVELLGIKTDPGTFAGQGNLRLNHRFYYHHDNGVFELYDGSRTASKNPVETIKADFEEQYSLAEEKCNNAQQAATNDPTEVSLIDYAVSSCLYARNYAASKTFNAMLKDNLAEFPSSDRATAEHKYHTYQGRHELLEANVGAAKKHLLLSVEVKPTAVMTSFGPNMSLARDLLLAGESEIVVQYLDKCAEFWNDEQVETWKSQIGRGVEPNFGANLYY